jgi:hypothetical protein
LALLPVLKWFALQVTFVIGFMGAMGAAQLLQFPKAVLQVPLWKRRYVQDGAAGNGEAQVQLPVGSGPKSRRTGHEALIDSAAGCV